MWLAKTRARGSLCCGHWAIVLAVFVVMFAELTHATFPPSTQTKSPTTAAPTAMPAPTAPPSPQGQPNRATSRRVATLQDCAKQGRNVNCAFNPQIVVYDGYQRICEPTESFLGINATSPCYSLSNTTCAFDQSYKCVSRNEMTCLESPLWRLMARGRELVRQSAALSTEAADLDVTIVDVIRRSYQCTDLTNNITCMAAPFCEWVKTLETPSRIVTEGIIPDPDSPPTNITNSDPQVPESQILELLSSTLPERPDLKQIRISVDRSQHENTIMVTTQVRWVSSKDEIQPKIGGGSFVVKYVEGSTTVLSDPVPFDATSAQFQTILRRISQLNDATVTANVDRIDEWGRKSWAVKARRINNLQINSRSFNDDNGVSINSASRVSITRHERNRQIVMMFGPSEPQTGRFSIGYTALDYFENNFQIRDRAFHPSFGTVLTREIDALESAESFQKKLNDIAFGQVKVLDFVSVRIPDTATMQALDARASELGIGSQLRVAWVIEFTTLVNEYERAEFPLTIIPVQLVPIPFYGVSGANGAIMDLTVQVDVASPVAHGRLGKPQFYTAADPLPGLFALSEDDGTILYANRNVSLIPGDCLRLGGRYHVVDSVEFTAPPQYYLTIHLTAPVGVSNYVNDTSYKRTIGWQAFSCRPILGTVDTSNLPSINPRAGSAELEDILSRAGMPYFTQLRATVVERSDFGEVVVNVSIKDEDGTVPRLDFFRSTMDVLLPSCSKWNPVTCAQLSVVNVESGIARPSGSFRLVFAGYGGKDFPDDPTKEYVIARIFDSTSPLVQSSQSLDNSGGHIDVVHPDGNITLFHYSAPLSLDFFTRTDIVLDTLQSLTPDIAEIESTAFKVELLSPSKIRIIFLLNSVEFAKIWALPADVPQLASITSVKRNPRSRGLLGTDVDIKTYTEVQGVGTLYNQVVTFDKADNIQRSPCRAEPSKRRNDMAAAFGDVSILDELDQKTMDCATFGTTRSACVGPEEVVQDCIWRGPDTPTLLDPPMGVDSRFLQRFWSTDEFFKLGPNSVTVNSNCTLSPVAALGIMVRMLMPLTNRLQSVNASVLTPALRTQIDEFNLLYSSLQSDVDKFDRCGRNPVVEVQATQGGFVDVWQWLVTTTSYTCMLAYGLAGALLAYRMDKFKLLGFKWLDTFQGIMIIFGATCLGGIYGFVIGAVPAALISQMYASIPVSLSFDWAVSLGVAQGVLIIYFDMGRGGSGIEAEIAFKHGR